MAPERRSRAVKKTAREAALSPEFPASPSSTVMFGSSGGVSSLVFLLRKKRANQKITRVMFDF